MMVAQPKLDNEKRDDMGAGAEVIQTKLLASRVRKTLEIIQSVNEALTHEQLTLGCLLSTGHHLLFPSTPFCFPYLLCKDLPLSQKDRGRINVQNLEDPRI